jgi:hypothetical protein
MIFFNFSLGEFLSLRECKLQLPVNLVFKQSPKKFRFAVSHIFRLTRGFFLIIFFDVLKKNEYFETVIVSVFKLK